MLQRLIFTMRAAADIFFAGKNRDAGDDEAIESVYVTGSFDGWSKSQKMVRTGSIWEKSVELPRVKTQYKVSLFWIGFLGRWCGGLIVRGLGMEAGDDVVVVVVVPRCCRCCLAFGARV